MTIKQLYETLHTLTAIKVQGGSKFKAIENAFRQEATTHNISNLSILLGNKGKK